MREIFLTTVCSLSIVYFEIKPLLPSANSEKAIATRAVVCLPHREHAALKTQRWMEEKRRAGGRNVGWRRVFLRQCQHNGKHAIEVWALIGGMSMVRCLFSIILFFVVHVAFCGPNIDTSLAQLPTTHTRRDRVVYMCT